VLVRFLAGAAVAVASLTAGFLTFFTAGVVVFFATGFSADFAAGFLALDFAFSGIISNGSILD
jgi:hypothetical protein